MSAPTQNTSAAPLKTQDTPQKRPFPHPIFLMVNSLERGGTERQFVELASTLKSDGTQVHLGCIQRIRPFLEKLGRSGFQEVAEFGLGHSLYGFESVKCRWRLMRHLRRQQIAVA